MGAMGDRPEEARPVIMAELQDMVDKQDKHLASGAFELFTAQLAVEGKMQDENTLFPTASTTTILTQDEDGGSTIVELDNALSDDLIVTRECEANLDAFYEYLKEVYKETRGRIMDYVGLSCEFITTEEAKITKSDCANKYLGTEEMVLNVDTNPVQGAQFIREHGQLTNWMSSPYQLRGVLG